MEHKRNRRRRHRTMYALRIEKAACDMYAEETGWGERLMVTGAVREVGDVVALLGRVGRRWDRNRSIVVGIYAFFAVVISEEVRVNLGVFVNFHFLISITSQPCAKCKVDADKRNNE